MGTARSPFNATNRPRALRNGVVAVFDLDGTLTRRDTFLPFLISYAGRRFRVWPLVTLPLYLGLYLCRLIPDRVAKERLLVSFLGGQKRAAVAEHADWFCRNWLIRSLRHDVVEKLREHQVAGHRVILLSASPEVYVPRIAESLEIHETICTRVFGDCHRWDGSLVGANCKGPEKLNRLCEYLADEAEFVESFAYGDRWHDLPVLEWANYGYLWTRKSGLIAVQRPTIPIQRNSMNEPVALGRKSQS